MLDDRMPDDCLYICLEADFRFYQTDCMEVEEWLPLAMWGTTGLFDISEQEQSTAAASSSSGGVGASRPAPPKFFNELVRPDVETLGVHKGLIQMPKPYTSLHDDASQELVDIVATATQAHQTACGEVSLVRFQRRRARS